MKEEEKKKCRDFLLKKEMLRSLVKLKWRENTTSSGGAHLLRRHNKRFMTIVMSFGDGSQGALGLPFSQIALGVDAYEPTRVTALPSHVVSLSAGHYHSLAVTSHGHLWAWGRNNEAQLGRGFSPRYTYYYYYYYYSLFLFHVHIINTHI